ncbi:MAG: hypothetical protein AAGK04_02135 [Planctomycetota bacterium]
MSESDLHSSTQHAAVADHPFPPPLDDEGRALPRLPRVPEGADLREYTAIASLSREAKLLLPTHRDAESLLETLLDKGLYLDAIRLVARATHPQRSVEWALEDVRLHGDIEPGSDDDVRLAEVEQWLEKPNEDGRQSMMDRARAEGYPCAGSMVMGAVGWAYGSLGPKDLGVIVPPPDGLASKSAANALIVTATRRPKLIGVIAPKMIRRGLEHAQMEEPEPWPPEDEVPEMEPEDGRPELPTLSKATAPAVITGPRQAEAYKPPAPPIRPATKPGEQPDQGGWAPKPL